MKRKLLMILSAVTMGIIGIIFTFMPDEILHFLFQESNVLSKLVLQITGALYFGFAIVNWTAKNIPIGGIYAKPLSLGNFTHFFIGAVTLLKVTAKGDVSTFPLWVFTVAYIAFAVAFGFVSFTSPKLETQNTQ